jgi:putative heme degradation protein
MLLRPDAAGILAACAEAGPLFVLFRNQGCIFGSVADPLWQRRTGDVHVVAGGALDLNLATRRAVRAISYLEPGPQGGFIDAVEFCAPGDVGFFKVCRMAGGDAGGWQEMQRKFRADALGANEMARVRKTNHLDVPVCTCGRPDSPAEALLERFLECALRCGATLHLVATAARARGRLAIRATRRRRVGHWTVLFSETTAFHLASGCVSELRVVTRPHVVLLVLLGPGGRLLARISTRDRELLSRIRYIL